MFCRKRSLPFSTRNRVRHYASSGWTLNAPQIHSPKVHAFQFLVSPARAIPRLQKVSNAWQPNGVSSPLNWRCIHFGLLYYPIWYSYAELRADVIIPKEKRNATADVSISGGFPGYSDTLLSTLNFQSYLPSLGSTPFPPNRQFTKSLLHQHGHDILQLPFRISPFVFDLLDFETCTLSLEDTVTVEQNPKILFNVAFPVLTPLYMATYEATHNGATFVQHHCLEAFSKDLGGHFYTTYTKDNPTTTTRKHTLLNIPSPQPNNHGVKADVRFRKDLKPATQTHIHELLVEAKTSQVFIDSLANTSPTNQTLPLDMDDIRIRPLRENEVSQVTDFTNNLRALSEFQHARLYSPSKVAFPQALHDSLRSKFIASKPDWWLAYSERGISRSSAYPPDVNTLTKKSDDPVVLQM